MSKIKSKSMTKTVKHIPRNTGKFEKNSGKFPGKILQFPGREIPAANLTSRTSYEHFTAYACAIIWIISL